VFTTLPTWDEQNKKYIKQMKIQGVMAEHQANAYPTRRNHNSRFNH
jgi:hypothetical protein